MTVLAIDAATAACSAALWADGRVLARRFALMERGQAEALMPMVDEVLREAGLGFADVTRFAVTIGPGAFTGLRIGLAAARGMALAAGRPLVGITTFEAVAYGIPEDERAGCSTVVVIDSRREDLFFQVFDRDLHPVGAPFAALPEAAILPDGPLLIAGDAAARLGPALTRRSDARFAEGPGVPDAAVVARLAAARAIDPAAPPPAPLYLRAPDVTLPGSRGR